jgi:SAM-dependent methyltransferase
MHEADPCATRGVALSQAEAAMCHACKAARVMENRSFPSLRRVSSDCVPQPAAGRLGACPACGLVQACVDQAWRQLAASIYEAYAIYHQGGGAEQAVFEQGDGQSMPRSRRLVDAMLQCVSLPQTGRALDIGCGNGGFLRALSAARPGWTLVGTELDGRHREDVLAIAGVETLVAAADPAEVEGRFDLVSLVHVLEHIVDPAGFLSRVADRLADDGVLLIQVPYFPRNPFELLIADHCSHFTPATMTRLLGAAGLRPVHVSIDWVVKELSVLAQRGPCELSAGNDGNDGTDVTVGVDWLVSTRDVARRVARQAARPIGVFGTSIAGTWLAVELGDAVALFVDEDAARVGQAHMGRPILSPRQVEPGTDVFIALPTPLARAVASRVGRDDVRYHLPTPLATWI